MAEHCNGSRRGDGPTDRGGTQTGEVIPSDDTQRARREKLSGESQRLLTAIDEIHDLETSKRDQDISTPPFHALADQVLDKSREVFRMAGAEADLDDEIETTDVTLNDVEPRT